MHPQKSKKDNILITTGGTISTELVDGYLRPNKVDVAHFFGQYFFDKKYSPFCILSENLTLELCEELCEVIRADYENANSFIVAAGTDNLAFLANYIALRLYDIPCPLVIVSADLPLSDKKTNGLTHIEAAKLVAQKVSRGVFVVYEDAFQKNKINVHYGSRVLPLREFTGVCESANGSTFGHIKNGELTINENDKNEQNCVINADFELTLAKNALKSVFFISPHVGFSYKSFSYNLKNSDIIVSSSYHSGTICSHGEDSINDIKNDCYIAGGRGGIQYESREKVKANIKFVDNIAPLALYIKVLLSYNLNAEDKGTFIKTSVADEYF